VRPDVSTVYPEVAQKTYDRIHALRLRLRDEPRNSIAWIDLARQHTVLGHAEQASRAVRIAVNISPTNRFILRCAARFLIHVRDLHGAHRLLRTAPSTPYDPWLTAAEIAVASAANIQARFGKSGQKLFLSADHSHFHTSELASALGTMELEYGKSRNARKLFNDSLRSPTENAIAQAQWASKKLTRWGIDLSAYKSPCTYEAKAWENFDRGLWDEALQGSTDWLLDEPFSTKAAALGSYIASTVMEDYTRAERILKEGLIASPNCAILRNNLAFVYGSMGRSQEAEQQIGMIHQATMTPTDEITVLATKGLILFRKGIFEKGRELYRAAMEKADRSSFDNHRARAAVYLAREEILAKSPVASEALQQAMEECSRMSAPEFDLLSARLQAMTSWGGVDPSGQCRGA